MLVLSRKSTEKIIIDETIVLTVVRIGPKTVRLGIDAPKGMKIVRAEIQPEAPVRQGMKAEG